MNIENEIKSVIESKLQEGIIEKLVGENLEKGINSAISNLMGSYGDVTKVIEKKIKDVMIDQLSGYDYSKYIVKLDHILTEILKHTALDNRKILENFKDLMTDTEIPKVINVSDIFEEYCKYVAKNIDTSDLEVNTDDGNPSYEFVDVSFEATENEKRSWSSYENYSLFFECEKDENMNFEVKLKRWKNDKYWHIQDDEKYDIESLRRLNKFKIYLFKIKQKYANIQIDTFNGEEEVQPEAEPEASFS
jgi:hypothetical protein